MYNHKEMHILLIHQAFAAINEPGGTRHYEMAKVFTEHGHRVTVITSPVSYLTGKSAVVKPKWVTRESPEPGITILRAYTYPALHRSFFHRLINFFSFMFSSFFIGMGVKDVDVVWGTTPPIFQGWTAWLLARLKKVKFLFEVRDLWPAFAVAVGVLKNPVLIWLSTWLEKFLYRHADEIVVNSPGFIEHIRQRDGKEIQLVPNGVDLSMFDPDDEGRLFRDTHNLKRKFVVLYAGAHGISNDLPVVLSAARMTINRPEVVYLLVGDGKEKDSLVRSARSENLPNVRFLPPVAKNKMAQVLAAADACIAILKPIEMYKTTYPNKVFDYMAAGKPVLCVIDGVIRKVIEDSGSGIFIEPGNSQALADAILKLYRNRSLGKTMGAAGRKCVTEQFDRYTLAMRMEKIFINLSSK